MAQVNIVFLIDVNGIPKEQAHPSTNQDESLELFKEERETEVIGGEQSLPQPTSTTSHPHFTQDDGGENFMEWLKEFVLVTLHREAYSGGGGGRGGGDYDYSKVQWAFKFFNSSQHVDYRECKGFLPFDNESYTNFESQLNQRMKISGGGGVGGGQEMDAYSQMDSSKVKYLSDAIKIITGGLPWTEAPQAANLSKSFNGGGLMMEETVAKNSVYTLFRVPRTERQLEQFSGVQGNGSTKDFMGVLLPAAFSSTFHHKLRIQLNFVDMWAAPENKDHCFDPDWSGSYPKQIVKCLHYLGNGKVVGVPFGELATLKSTTMQLGLVPYMSLLRGRLEQVSKLEQTENIPQCIQKLVPQPQQKGLQQQQLLQQKISPPVDLDTSSLTISRSYKSASVLEASFKLDRDSLHQKVLRPFRMSTGGVGGGGYGGEDEDTGDYGYQRRLSDHQRGDRKRKRWEFDREEEYQHQDRRRFSGGGRRVLEEDDGDSVEVDSQCERDQRLENWVKDGVFSKKGGGGKGKSHHHHQPLPPTHAPTSTTAVPMSRPGFHHVFHEPAPKIPGSHRNKKMLAIVERKKIKANIALETKRRSGGGGGAELDMKRINQKQEKELSAIKRRLKTFLEGELEFQEADPLEWMKSFQSELRKFADMILAEEEPCLVALAQALVNCASVKFTPQRLALIRHALGAGYTAKDLLEEILLDEFTNLNRRIIQAHEKKASPAVGGGGGGGGGLQQKLQKILTFRETELQIILRLEIAWCFFIEPDEEATEELLQEIVRLLQIIAAYRTEPPIDYFVNTVLLPTYSQSSKFMRALYKKMNIPLPNQLAMDGSPVPSSSRRDDDSSMISSTSSANLYPEDSASQLNSHYSRHHNSHHHHHQQHKRHRPSPSAGKRKGGSGGKKVVKRQIMVATTSNPKLPSSHFLREDDRHLHRKSSGGALGGNGGGGGVKISPKRVRRNLFDVQKKDKKDSKTLLTLAFSSGSGSGSRLTKSPGVGVGVGTFKSPKLHKSPMRSPSAFFRAARSRKQLSLSQHSGDKQFGSPKINDHVLCPESPATPGDRMSMASRYAPTTTSNGSSERHRVIQESPEVHKNEFDNRPMGRVASCSFYSTNAPKSRAWEKSETQLMAARIKESVDLRSQQLTLDDLEIIPPRGGAPPHSAAKSSCPDTPKTNLSYCADSYTERLGDGDGGRSSPIPESDFATGPAPSLDNPNIQALITSRSIFPNILAAEQGDNDNNPPTPVKNTRSPPHPTTVTSPSTSNLQTPSKRVQFNLNENLVNTPSSEARRSSTPGTTPKSILKDHAAAAAPVVTSFTLSAHDSTV